MSTYETPTANGPSARIDDPSDSTAQQAKDKAQQAAGQARRGLRDQVDTRSTDAGHRVSGVAQDVREVADQLRGQGKDQPARLAEQAAQRADSLGDYLKRSDGDTILRDVEDFGRSQPWALVAGGLALGFAASRFLKASSSERYRSSREFSPPPRQIPTGIPGNGQSDNPVGSVGVGSRPPYGRGF